MIKPSKAPRYTFNKSYKDYVKEVGKKNALSWVEYHVVEDFLEDLARAIIIDKYEWKVQPMGGFLRIEKTRSGWFYFFWDRAIRFTRIPKQNLWSFTPTRGYQTTGDIGEAGLNRRIIKCKEDPYLPRYDVMKKRHYRRNV